MLLALATVIGGCDGGTTGGGTTGGGTTGGGTTGAGTTGGTTGSSLTIYCCLNGSYYDCPSQAALDKCIPPNFMGTPDPSACSRNVSKDGKCNSGTNGATTGATTGSTGGTTGSSGGCGGAISLGSCTIDSDCFGSLEHCTNGKCYSNAGGSPCTIDRDCGSLDHCTSGCCYANAIGSPCTIDADCGISSCVNGTCN
jgi:hypothetical protein